ncbi:uncharacterized protein F4822DRAFT_385189, partial [Hypoxylon trugodes]|uniref:uncharacterized protein n=1 Tax=Hypoxylon trugodes TaxID=326681 RepID=UPI00219DCC82
MTDWKGIVKKGWHPEKEGTSLKGQVKGLVGRGDKSSSPSTSNHSAPPISSLRDPSSFGPPPKHVATGGSGSPSVQTSSPTTQQYQSHAGQTYGIQEQHQSQVEQPTEPKPYRLNTTGLSTTHLPPPPLRHSSPNKREPLPPPRSPIKPASPPSLPPRLPPRSGTSSPAQTQSPISTGGSQPPSYLNQGAVDRLGAAGISVPEFGIGGGGPPPPPPARPASPPKPSNGLGGLQSRFSKLGTGTSQQESTATPMQGTSWADKQAALRTASNFKKDPSSVSFADAKAAAGTAHNFQQRHGDQVASGLSTANRLNQRFNDAGDGGQGPATATSPMSQISGVIGKKKPAPPPPSKKPQLSTASNGASGPPPVPMASKPRF